MCAVDDDGGQELTLADGLRPVADVAEGVATAAEELVRQALPRDGSPAMTDLATEMPWQTAEMNTPVVNTLTYASLLGYAATDALKAMVLHLRAPDLVWAPFINARSGLDAASTAFWLVEPGIYVDERVRRGMALRLHSARELKKGPSELNVGQHSATTVSSVREAADELGWQISGSRQRQARVGRTTMPTPKQRMDAVLRFRQGPDHETVAHVSWWFYSGLTHATPYALLQFVDHGEARDGATPGVREAPLVISGPQLVSAVGALGRAVLNLAVAHGLYLGVDVTQVEKVGRSFDALIVETLDAMSRAPARTLPFIPKN